MRYIAAIIIIGFILYLSFGMPAQDNFSAGAEQQETGQTTEEPTPPPTEDPDQEPEDDDYFLADDQDIFSRKLFLKKLSPLTKKEEIVWAFRLSTPHTFL